MLKRKKTKVSIKKSATKHKKDIFAAQKNVVANALKMYGKRTIIFNAFINKDIYSGDVGKDVYYNYKESKPKFEKSIAERTKMRKQKSDGKNQEGQGLEILTPDQVLSRLQISLAQLKVGSNSEKLKNEIRQPLYSLYRSKKLSKAIYDGLISTTKNNIYEH